MKKKLMKKTLVIATLSIMLLSGLNSVSAMKTVVQNDSEDTLGTKEITIYVYIDENENKKFDDGESLATSAYVQVQRCDPVFVNTIPGCSGWINRETGSVTINVPKTLMPGGDYSIIASENKIYFSLDQYKGRSSDISGGDMKDGAEFWVGMTYFERKSKDLVKTPTPMNSIEKAPINPTFTKKNSNDFHILLIEVRHVRDDPEFVICDVFVNGKREGQFGLLLLFGRTFSLAFVKTNDVTIEIDPVYSYYTKAEFDLSNRGTFVRFLAIVNHKKIEIVE
jgi:hypothetical protein